METQLIMRITSMSIHSVVPPMLRVIWHEPAEPARRETLPTMSNSIHSVAGKPGPWLAGTAFGLAFVSISAAATDTDANKLHAQTRKRSKTLSGVTVQASTLNPVSPKFTADLLDTPRTVSIIPQQMIQSTAANTLSDALRLVPGITFGAGEGGSPLADIPYIRGFDAGSDILIDGVRDIGAQTRESFDIDQIDVIKGPSSIYTGRGAAGGSINITTKSPELRNVSQISQGIGTDSYYRTTYDGNYVLGRHTAARIDVMGNRASTPGRNDINGHRYGVAPSISFGLGTPDRLTVKLYHMYDREVPDSGIPYNYQTGTPERVNRNNFYGLLGRDFRKTQADIGSIHFEHDFNDAWTLHETTRYGRSSYNYIWTSPDDANGNVAHGFVYRYPKTRIGATNEFVQQVDLSGAFDTVGLHHSVAVGLEYEHDMTRVERYAVTAPGGSGLTCNPSLLAAYTCTPLQNPDANQPWLGSYAPSGLPTWTRTTTKSFYAMDTITVSDQWTANLGTRYDNYHTGADTRLKAGTSEWSSVRNIASFWSWQAGLVYKPVENASIYASWATSSSPSGLANGEGDQHVSTSLTSANDLAPQKMRNIELGAKWNLFDDALNLSAALFHARMSNALVQIDASTYALAGVKDVRGFELGWTGKISKQWSMFGGYTHLDPMLHSSGALAASDGNGKMFPNVARNSGTLWTYYAPDDSLRFGLGVYANSKQYGNVLNTLRIQGYARIDAMADYKVSRRLDLQLNLLNLANRRYYTQAYAIAFAQEAPARAAMLTANLHL